MGASNVIDLVEAAYDLTASPQAWLTEVAARYDACLDARSIVLEFDVDLPASDRIPRVAAPSLGTTAERWIGRVMASGPLLGALGTLQGPPHERPRVARLNDELAKLPLLAPLFRPFVNRLGYSDAIALSTGDGSPRGMILNALEHGGRRIDTSRLRQAIRALPHLGAGLRLRRALAREDDVVLEPDGRLRDGAVDHDGRARLRDAVIARDRSRTRQGRADPDAALAAWTALVEGRWSLVDVFEHGALRYVLARPNLPDVRDPRGLTPLERAILALVLRGLANKVIAYDLGLADGTVSSALTHIRAKLGDDLLQVATRVGAGTPVPVRIGDEQLCAIVCTPPARDALASLTPAERAVVLDVIAGRSNTAIAARRGASPRTVANQLASAYKKLGVGSRRELRARVR